jgi:uncharacterized protein (TIGR00162 family)
MEKFIVNKKQVICKNPVLIEGLPGIGNVGKIVVDFLIDQLDHELVYEIYSKSFPHSVFVNEDNIIELPKVDIYKVSLKNQDLLLLSGDIQPVDEESSYEFSNLIVDIAKENGCKEIITLGGIGLNSEPSTPKVYGVATDSKIKEKYKTISKNVNFDKVKAEAIIGATGLILGLANLKKISGVGLLVETFAHQFHIGLKESKELLKSIKNIFNLEIELSDLDKEIKQEEKNKAKDLQKQSKVLSKTVKRINSKGSDTSYIG